MKKSGYSVEKKTRFCQRLFHYLMCHSNKVLLHLGSCEFMKLRYINAYLPSGLFHPYQLDESISIFRGD